MQLTIHGVVALIRITLSVPDAVVRWISMVMMILVTLSLGKAIGNVIVAASE